MGSPLGNFGDVDPGAQTILVRFTIAGDVNLDGVVDDGDVGLVNINYDPSCPAGTYQYWQGDVWAYDGIIDDGDVGIVNINYGSSVNDLLGTLGLGGAQWSNGYLSLDLGAVPEPATLALLALGGMLALARRRRSA